MVGRARDVRLGDLATAAETVRKRPLPAWDGVSHFADEPERARRYLMVLDTINFSFWLPGGWTGQRPGGYTQMAERLRDVYRAGTDLEEPDSLAAIDGETLGRLLGPFPMLAERAQALNELGHHGYDGLVGETAVDTARNFGERLDSYRDVSGYEGREVPFLKRAQIVAADLHAAGLAGFPDLDQLTCFADYKLPQVLRHLGALEYSSPLAARVDGWVELRSGEPAEVEIRAATVVAVERLRQELTDRGRRLTSVEVDWLLWHLAQETFPMPPYHRVRGIYY
ncbi:MAG: queuosine salvage family protein [Candidatus Dormibacteraeota bacterium]|nr:queuosine salvage family protein [Candidatus Dormibacteraeota bacterium]